MENTFSVTCPSCGHSFKVRIPEGSVQGKRYRINYSCPRCGKQVSELRTINTVPQGSHGQSLKYIIGIPVVVLLAVFLVSAIAGRSGNSSPLFQDMNLFRQRVTGYLGSQEMIQLGSKLIVLLLCFPIHECAHAWMADKLGDPTGRNRGRITLNPLKHLDPWGTITIFLFGIGYAKPVPVSINNFRHRKRDFALTAIAGPVSNLLMAVVMLVLMRLLPGITGRGSIGDIIANILIYAAYINISLAVFNLIPIPPLDGSRVLTAILPDGAYNAVLKYERYMMLALLLAIFMLGRMGYSPIGTLAGRIFRFLYRMIVTG